MALKCAGLRCTVTVAIIALCCRSLNGRFEDFGSDESQTPPDAHLAMISCTSLPFTSSRSSAATSAVNPVLEAEVLLAAVAAREMHQVAHVGEERGAELRSGP